VAVPNAFVKDWLHTKYHKFILKCLRDMANYVRNIEFVIAKEEDKRKLDAMDRPFMANISAELPLQDYYINKEDNLNPRYIFENFVVGPFNELAFAASQAVIKKPLSYNPLFIYGGTGRGKTHLIQAVGNAIKNSTSKKIYYLTAEKFSVDFVNSMNSSRINQFKERYRKYDVLIMDDIQFFSKKEKFQEELFHLFNYLYENGRQIIFSSDKHPNIIPDLEDRLKSRFGQGMIVDIPEPDLETRISILEAKAKAVNLALDKDIITYVATQIEGNIRELEGILNSIIIQSQVKNRLLNINEIKNLIKNNIKPKKNISIKDIIKIVADFYNIEEQSIYEKTRRKEVVLPRQLAMYILREDFNVSYPSIGQKLGGRDHTTVIHSCEKIKEELKSNDILTQDLSQIRSMI